MDYCRLSRNICCVALHIGQVLILLHLWCHKISDRPRSQIDCHNVACQAFQVTRIVANFHEHLCHQILQELSLLALTLNLRRLDSEDIVKEW